MSVLDDARRLVASGSAPVDDQGDCWFCQAMTRDHESDCPWLALPRIVAALEAAELAHQAFLWRRSSYDDKGQPDQGERQAVAALLALRHAGVEPKAIPELQSCIPLPSAAPAS